MTPNEQERLLAILEGREVGRICPICEGGRSTSRPCSNCKGVGRVRTQPEGRIEEAAATLHRARDSWQHDAKIYAENAAKNAAERDTALARAEWAEARVSELVTTLDTYVGTPCEQIRHREQVEAYEQQGAKLAEMSIAGYQMSAELEHYRQEECPRLTRERNAALARAERAEADKTACLEAVRAMHRAGEALAEELQEDDPFMAEQIAWFNTALDCAEKTIKDFDSLFRKRPGGW